MASEIDFQAFLTAVTTKIQTEFPTLQTVTSQIGGAVPTALPALLLSVDRFDFPEDHTPFTGQLAADLTLTARLIWGEKSVSSALEATQLSADLISFIQEQRWGLELEPAQALEITLATESPLSSSHEVRDIRFTQLLWLGANLYAQDPSTPLPSELIIQGCVA